MPMTAHFHVIQQARARTSSRDTFQWYRMPPLKGPIASLYWTRYPVKTFTFPSSILTGKCTVSSRRGFFRTSSMPPSRFNFLPTRSICVRAISNGFNVSFGFDIQTPRRPMVYVDEVPRVGTFALKASVLILSVCAGPTWRIANPMDRIKRTPPGPRHAEASRRARTGGRCRSPTPSPRGAASESRSPRAASSARSAVRGRGAGRGGPSSTRDRSTTRRAPRGTKDASADGRTDRPRRRPCLARCSRGPRPSDDVLPGREEKGHRVLRDGRGVGSRVAANDRGPREPIERQVVDAREEGLDHPETGRPRRQVLRQFRAEARADEDFRGGPCRVPLGRRQGRRGDGLESGRRFGGQDGAALRVDRHREEDPGHGPPDRARGLGPFDVGRISTPSSRRRGI